MSFKLILLIFITAIAARPVTFLPSVLPTDSSVTGSLKDSEEFKQLLLGVFEGLHFYNYVSKEAIEQCYTCSDETKATVEKINSLLATIHNINDALKAIPQLKELVTVLLGQIHEQMQTGCAAYKEQAKQYNQAILHILQDPNYLSGLMTRFYQNWSQTAAALREALAELQQHQYNQAGLTLGNGLRELFLPEL